MVLIQVSIDFPWKTLASIFLLKLLISLLLGVLALLVGLAVLDHFNFFFLEIPIFPFKFKYSLIINNYARQVYCFADLQNTFLIDRASKNPVLGNPLSLNCNALLGG